MLVESIRLIKSKETNCGTAIVVIKIVLHNFFNLTVLLLINNATAIPKKQLMNVAKKAQTSVHKTTCKKVFINIELPTLPPIPKTVSKFFIPTQSISVTGERWLESQFVNAINIETISGIIVKQTIPAKGNVNKVL